MNNKKVLVKDYIKKYENSIRKSKSAIYNQLKFINDSLADVFSLSACVLADGYDGVIPKEVPIYVIETLKTRREVQPVYELLLKNDTIRMLFKCDHGTWIVAIDSKIEIKVSSKYILAGEYFFFDEDFEGFSNDATFDNYCDNHFRFATIFYSDNVFYTFCYLLEETLLDLQ